MFTSRRITTMGSDSFRDDFSLEFDGSNDYVSTQFSPDYIHTNASMGMWIKLDNFDDSQQIGCGGSSKGWAMGFNGSSQAIISVANTNNVGAPITISPTPVIGQWIHYVVTAIDGTATVYINGVAQGTMSYTQNSSHNPSELANNTFSIGMKTNHDATSTVTPVNGKISEVFQYNKGLTAFEVRAIYNNREPYNHKEGIASGNLNAWWRMGDGRLDKTKLDMGGSGDTGLICDEVNPTLGAELVSNGDFDDETNWSDYSLEAPDTVDLSTEQVLVGSNSLKVSVSNANEGTRLEAVAVTAGKTYKISAWFYVTAGTAKINPGDGKWSPNAYEPKTNVTNEWQQLLMYNTADADESNAWIYFQAGSNNSVFYIDNVSIKEVKGNPGILLRNNTEFTGDTP